MPEKQRTEPMRAFSLSPLSYTARTKTFPGTLILLERIHSVIERKVFSLSILVYTASRRTFPGTLEFSGIFCARAIAQRIFSFVSFLLYTAGKKYFPGTLDFSGIISFLHRGKISLSLFPYTIYCQNQKISRDARFLLQSPTKP